MCRVPTSHFLFPWRYWRSCRIMPGKSPKSKNCKCAKSQLPFLLPDHAGQIHEVQKLQLCQVLTSHVLLPWRYWRSCRIMPGKSPKSNNCKCAKSQRPICCFPGALGDHAGSCRANPRSHISSSLNSPGGLWKPHRSQLHALGWAFVSENSDIDSAFVIDVDVAATMSGEPWRQLLALQLEIVAIHDLE